MIYEDYESLERINERPVCEEDLRPYLNDRTLLYGYTCDRQTFHVYIKDKKIHAVIYCVDYSEESPKPVRMREVKIKSNEDYIPDKRLYPETCDYMFCVLLKSAGIYLPFTGFDKNRSEKNFYGFTLEDMK